MAALSIDGARRLWESPAGAAVLACSKACREALVFKCPRAKGLSGDRAPVPQSLLGKYRAGLSLLLGVDALNWV